VRLVRAAAPDGEHVEEVPSPRAVSSTSAACFRQLYARTIPAAGTIAGCAIPSNGGASESPSGNIVLPLTTSDPVRPSIATATAGTYRSTVGTIRSKRSRPRSTLAPAGSDITVTTRSSFGTTATICPPNPSASKEWSPRRSSVHQKYP
jgi:hypothetical protein